ncbi:DUF2254 domain-containing protein [soil metagenome]
MKTWLMKKWDSLRGTFWFLPLLMVAGAAVLSFITLAIDKTATENGLELTMAWTFTRGPEGSRALLATVAGSMITIASVCFSITIVALQQASSQFGPRILHNFMRDRGNQAVLGTFIAGFTYCLLVLRTVNGTEGNRFVPHLSVTVGLLLALAGVAVLIYFIHHASSSIQAEHVIAGVSRDLDDALDRLFPSKLGGEPKRREEMPAEFGNPSVPVPAGESGYLQAVNVDWLMGIAVKHDLTLKLENRPGEFVIRGNPLANGWPAERMTDEAVSALRNAFYLGNRRTLFQDVEFAIDQLVEIALRALSPGINDPFTALACVDRLGAALATVAGKEIPSAYRYDEEGRLRVVAEGVTPAGIVDAAFHQLRQASRNNAAVTIRLLETIALLGPRVQTRDLREALLTQAEVILEGSREGLPAKIDQAAAQGRYESVIAAFRVSVNRA